MLYIRNALASPDHMAVSGLRTSSLRGRTMVFVTERAGLVPIVHTVAGPFPAASGLHRSIHCISISRIDYVI